MSAGIDASPARRDHGCGLDELQEAREAANDSGREPESVFRDDGLQPGERNLASSLAAETARKNAKDVLLQEAVNILGDEVGVLKNGTRVAARGKPDSSLTD